MKRSLILLVVSVLFLGLGCMVHYSVFNVTLETPTPLPQSDPDSSLPVTIAAENNNPTAMPTLVENGDPFGELYFSIVKPREYAPPATPPPGVDESTMRLARLPGSCVVGLVACPAPEIVTTPFDMKDVLTTDSDSGALTWSPDGRYGLLVIHPQDEITRGWTTEEWEKFIKTDLTISKFRRPRFFFSMRNRIPGVSFIAPTGNSSIPRAGRLTGNGSPSAWHRAYYPFILQKRMMAFTLSIPMAAACSDWEGRGISWVGLAKASSCCGTSIQVPLWIFRTLLKN